MTVGIIITLAVIAYLTMGVWLVGLLIAGRVLGPTGPEPVFGALILLWPVLLLMAVLYLALCGLGEIAAWIGRRS